MIYTHKLKEKEVYIMQMLQCGKLLVVDTKGNIRYVNAEELTKIQENEEESLF